MHFINETIIYLKEFNVISIIFRLILATILSGLIGSERSKIGRAAGLRTHIIVCIGSTIAAMTGLYLYEYYELSSDITRLSSQVISGIGFLGAGTILIKNKSIVTGLTTAACVWATGIIGIAIGYGFYEASIIGSILILFTIGKLTVIDKKLDKNINEITVYIEFEDAKLLNTTLKDIENNCCKIKVLNLTTPKTENHNSIGADIILLLHKSNNEDMIIEKLNNINNVNFAISVFETVS